MNDKMTWEQTIEFIRSKPEYAFLVEKAYFEKDLPLNVERFRNSEEFAETLNYLKKYHPNGLTLLDLGSGNGISAVALALEGYKVTSIEPDASNTIGAGAIRKLKDHYNLDNLEVYEAYAEEIKFPDNTFDIVYTRQCMHHAYDLGKFIGEASRVLKKNGLFISIRDHVIFDESDKKIFLDNHPLQKFYGGENAFKPGEYVLAMENAGLNVERQLKYYDSVINYFPMTTNEFENFSKTVSAQRRISLEKKIGLFAKFKLTNWLYDFYLYLRMGDPLNEKNVSGRMYSYICVKK